MNKAKKIAEARISASKAYLKKEQVRELLQAMIGERVADGTIVDAKTLAESFSDVEISLLALKSIPFEVWSKMYKKG